jgi:hypothetical protein
VPPPLKRKERDVLDAIFFVVRTYVEPKLDRDLELSARQYFDVYAMALPYRGSIVVDEAARPKAVTH